MSLSQIQTRKAIEKIIQYYLKNGRYPKFQTIAYHFSHWLRNHTPGEPSFRPIKAIRKEKSSAEQYNRNIELIHQDISDLYEETIDQTQRIMKDFYFEETEREKLWHDLQQLSNRIDELLLLTNNANRYSQNILLGFHNLNIVNQEKTTAFVNIKNAEVTLKQNRKESRKVLIDGSKAYFNLLTPAAKHAALETIHNAFDDNVNTAWWHVVKTKTPGTMRGELVVMFDQEEAINEISYVSHHVKPVTIKVEYTTDGGSFTPLPGKNNKRKIEQGSVWTFQEIRARGIKFIFEKKEHDDRSAGVYQYYFGAKDISVIRNHYVSEGVLYTKPITFDHNIRQASLYANDETPHNTSIVYEVGIYDPDKEVEDLIWYPVGSFNTSDAEVEKTASFHVFKDKFIDLVKCEDTTEIKNGLKVFRLLQEDGTPTIEDDFEEIHNIQLFRGIRQWKCEQTYMPFDGSTPLNHKWDEQYQNRPQAIKTSYVDIGNTLPMNREGGRGQDNFYRFTTCIYREDSENHPLSLSVINAETRTRIGFYTVYVNHERMIPSNDEVTLVLRPGWNEIQILYHWGNVKEGKDLLSHELPESTRLGKFNFSREQHARADLSPLKYVDPNRLFYNIPPNNDQYFSLHERQVVVNRDTKECRFQLTYEIDAVDKPHNQLVVKAILRNEIGASSVTPKIYNLQLRVK